MKTFSAKAEQVQRKWWLIDAKDQVLGQVAVKVANLLRGKNKAIFTPHVDTGDYVIIINAKDVRLTGKKETDKVYTRFETPGSIDQLIGRLRNEFSLTAPGADLLLANVFDDLMDDVVDAKHIGVGVVDGVECAHLAFRTPEVDWQMWVELGARPVPQCRLRSRLKNWLSRSSN